MNAQEVSLSLLKTKIFYFILSSILFFSLVNESLAQIKWSNSSKDSNSSKKGEWIEFIPKKGKAKFDSNQIVGCGSPQKTFTILFDGTPELPKCQIGVKEPYKNTKRDIDISEYDIHGTMRTKCADALDKLPQDIFVPSPTEIVGWCPYIHPRSHEFRVKKPNNFILQLKSLANTTGNSNTAQAKKVINTALNLDVQSATWRKGFSGLYPNHATDNEPSYGRKERDASKQITRQQSLLITAYLVSGPNVPDKLLNKIESILNIYVKNDAFEYLFNTPFSQHIKKRSADGGEGEMFDDYEVPGFWDNSATMGLNYFLPGIITLYSILKEERPEAENISEIKKYVQKLVWLNEQGLDYGVINKNYPMVPESANHHSASRAFIHLLWGVVDGDDKFFQAGANHFLSVLQDSRPDGSISSEVKPSPSAKSSHGGWGSLDRNNETLGYHALGAMLIHSQGYNVDTIMINGVNLAKNVEFGVSTFFEPARAKKWAKVKNYGEEYKNYPGNTTNKNLSWYLLSSRLLNSTINKDIEDFINKSKKQWKAENLGILDVRFFHPLEEATKVSNLFDKLSCGYKISKRGFDKKKNKNYEYTINFGRLTIIDGEVQFGMNKWKSGAISLDKNYLPNNSSIFVMENGDLNGTFPVFTATKKEKTVPVKIVSVERNDAKSPEGKFLALREDGEDFGEDTFILQVNSCN